MAQSPTPSDLIVEGIAYHPGCCLDDLMRMCPELTWNQIFLEVDQLSRTGHLRLALIGPGRYAVELPTHAVSCMRQSREEPVPPPTPEWHPQDARCERCSGLMVSERDNEFLGWRCILCGERTDPVTWRSGGNRNWPASGQCTRVAECSRRLEEERAHAQGSV